MRRALGAAAVAACLLGVGACSGGEPDAAPSPSSGSSTPSETPTASPTSTAEAPTLPPEAMERTAAGAEAFVRFYFASLNSALESGDVAAIDRHSEPQCQACAFNRDFVSEPYEAGGRWAGGHIRLLEMATPPLTDAGATVTVRLRQDAGVKQRGDGSLEATEAVPPFSANVYLHWDGAWRVAELTNV